ncbi:hypothetical protein ACWEU6_00750 [Streptosporangium sandarakinum]|uniref:hypothetical protein n=1 Tax=Streptosporangium sandarakinum TaxID=1260955 RepID=UPI0036CFB540
MNGWADPIADPALIDQDGDSFGGHSLDMAWMHSFGGWFLTSCGSCFSAWFSWRPPDRKAVDGGAQTTG